MSGCDVALAVEGLRVVAHRGGAIVEHVDLEVRRGEILGIVGESGSGKTTTALACLGFARDGTAIVDGRITVAGTTLPLEQETAVRRLRGRLISYVPQSPGTSLNPVDRIGDAVVEMARHCGAGEDPIRLFETVGLPSTREFVRRYPHQLSGGQQQRTCMAVALVCEPPVVVLDEPTTGLDVVVQARILEELLRLRRERHVAFVYVTHDLAVVAQVADRIAVMYAGRIVEEGPAAEILSRPSHPYTRGLLASTPDHLEPRALEALPGISHGIRDRPPGCSFADRCPLHQPKCDVAVPPLEEVAPGRKVRCLRWPETPRLAPKRGVWRSRVEGAASTVLTVEGLRAEHRSRQQTLVAARDVSFTIARGECVALVGESGSGKTTVARAIVGLHPLAEGRVLMGETALARIAARRTRDQRRRIQLIFQNPSDALNPRHTVRRSITRPARILRGLSRLEANAEAERLLEEVRLPRRLADAYPAELSGGERQRVAIARALAARPDLIICDEITSALDVSVQAAILELLEDLRTNLGLSMLFITHDLGVVASVANRVLVLADGVACEEGSVEEILLRPKHTYTRKLLEAAPSVRATLGAWRDSPSNGRSESAAATTASKG